ncbi:MAG TPA: hypothetical protein VH306_13835 [Gaiellaceae bacterium]
MLPAALGECCRNAHRAFIEIKEVVRELEPDPLAGTDHAGQEDEPLGVLGEPRCELVQFCHRKRLAHARAVPDRRDVKDPLIDSLATAARIAENPFQEFQFIPSRARMIRCSGGDEVFERSSPEVGQLHAPERSPDHC